MAEPRRFGPESALGESVKRRHDGQHPDGCGLAAAVRSESRSGAVAWAVHPPFGSRVPGEQ
jgi:hypothetical protein